MKRLCTLLLLFVSSPLLLLAQGWVGTWATAPQSVVKRFMPYNNEMTNRSVRQVIRVSIGGELVRLKLSNEISTEPVLIESIYIAHSIDSCDIDMRSARYMSFNGSHRVTIPAGKAITSDALTFKVNPLERLAITINYRKAPKKPTVHMGSRTTSYILKGQTTPYANFKKAFREDHWFNISALDVFDKTASSVAILGNSITDGKGATLNANDRWTDFMATHLHTAVKNTTSKLGNVGVLNLGIGFNMVLSTGFGQPAIVRFDRDILGQSKVKNIIIFEGINDIGTTKHPESIAKELITAYEEMIRKAHKHGIKVWGGTILPFKGNKVYYTEIREKARQDVNKWIRESKAFDGIIDFDELMRDATVPEQLKSHIHAGDWLHPNPAGYKMMGAYAAKVLLDSVASTN